jgi:hypothetical protein
MAMTASVVWSPCLLQVHDGRRTAGRLPMYVLFVAMPVNLVADACQ